MRLQTGATLTIRGRNFSRRRFRNTIIFRAPSGRTAFAKPRAASRRRLVVVVPQAIARLFSTRGGTPTPTRFRLRVLTRGFGAWTKRFRSPVVVPRGSGAGSGGTGTGTVGGTGSTGGTGTGGTSTTPPDCDHDGIPNSSESDDDGDLLPDTLEAQLGTDPCNRDSDGDGVEDGFEVQSAIDLNHYPSTPPKPYPGKRPYPNALDPSDAGTDYDGDGLSLSQEQLMWLRYSADGVPRAGRPTTLTGLLYSDGLQVSVQPAPAAPNPATEPLTNWALDTNNDGSLSDDERDADGDGLGNWDEASGRFTEAWWPKEHNGTIEPKESAYPGINFLDNADLTHHDAFADPDIDGDGVPDGADDQDHDGLSNQFEVRRPADWLTDAWNPGMTPGPNSWAYVNPFNPCKPFNSERCHRYIPFGYYDGDGVPPVGPTPPGGYPGTHPDTPDG
jgi:hypothetical protein